MEKLIRINYEGHIAEFGISKRITKIVLHESSVRTRIWATHPLDEPTISMLTPEVDIQCVFLPEEAKCIARKFKGKYLVIALLSMPNSAECIDYIINKPYAMDKPCLVEKYSSYRANYWATKYRRLDTDYKIYTNDVTGTIIDYSTDIHSTNNISVHNAENTDVRYLFSSYEQAKDSFKKLDESVMDTIMTDMINFCNEIEEDAAKSNIDINEYLYASAALSYIIDKSDIQNSKGTFNTLLDANNKSGLACRAACKNLFNTETFSDMNPMYYIFAKRYHILYSLNACIALMSYDDENWLSRKILTGRFYNGKVMYLDATSFLSSFICSNDYLALEQKTFYNELKMTYKVYDKRFYKQHWIKTDTLVTHLYPYYYIKDILNNSTTRVSKLSAVQKYRQTHNN